MGAPARPLSSPPGPARGGRDAARTLLVRFELGANKDTNETATTPLYQRYELSNLIRLSIELGKHEQVRDQIILDAVRGIDGYWDLSM